MQLLRLEMKGFKSFADKTVVTFSPGMTAIVGPNGSGKSNITDAIRWVLGESNIRNLRGQKAEDIIFSGTERRRSLGAAEVTLVFDNTDGQLGEELTEVALCRRIYRTGESEFFINKRACRLKDIHLLLADTGLGKDSMAIIGQNRIDAILNSKPEERRLIFEDVAGISRFKLNKEDALRRIHGTERNMERIQDILITLEEQLDPLREKADKTIQYMALSREKRLIDGALAFHNYKTADRLYTRFENDNLSYIAEINELEAEKTRLDADRQDLQSEMSRGQEQLKEWEASFASQQREEARLAGERKLLEEQCKTVERDKTNCEHRISELEATRKAEEQQILILQHMLTDERQTLERQKNETVMLENKYREASITLQEAQENLRQYQETSDSRHQQHIELVAAMETNKSDMKSLVTRIEESKELEKNIIAEMKDLEIKLAKARAEHEQITQQYESSKANRSSYIEQDKVLTSRMKDMNQQLQTIRRTLQKTEGRLELLTQWEEQHEGYVEGTKNILKATAPWRNQVKGAVGELFTVQESYAMAIEIALGGSINHIVTTSSSVAADCVRYLKDTQGGCITLLPMETVHGRVIHTEALQEEGVKGLAVDCIHFDEAYRGIFTYLLGRILVVDSMTRAIEIQKKYHQQLRIVTLTGEQFSPGGSLTGGTSKKRKGSVVARKEEMRHLEQTMTSLQEQQAQLVETLAASEREQEALQQDRKEIDDRLQQLHLVYTSGETKIDTLTQQRKRNKETLEAHREKCEVYTKTIKQLQETVDHCQGEIDDILSSDREQDMSQQMMAKVEELQAIQQSAYESFTTMRISCETLEKTIHDREKEMQQKEETLVSLADRMAPLANEVSSLEHRMIEVLPQQMEELQKQLEQVASETKRLAIGRQDAYTMATNRQASMEEMIEKQQTLDKRYKRVQQQLLDMESRLTRYKLDCERSVASLDELGFTLEEAQAITMSGSVSEWKASQADLLARITELGPINPAAIEEFEEAKERHHFLQTQLDDLDTAKHQLEDVIVEMDTAMSTQLVDVLHVVGEQFQRVFSQLFNGGTAQIVQTDPDNILTSGIDFYIQPPGKKRQQLTLLSGGERALTVIALLFSFLFYRPAPFCVLDEVDAALDEANVERFSQYLRQLDQATQFIVVSHRKTTMEAAEVLQGVTMVEQGISRLLTVAFEDVKEDLT